MTGPPGALQPTLLPRLLDAPTAARYLGVSERSLRALEAAGTVRRVEIPELRKVVFDRVQLDRLVEAWAR